MSTALLADALYKALERAYKENGFLTTVEFESSQSEANHTSAASLADAMYVALERAHIRRKVFYITARVQIVRRWSKC